MNKVISAGIFIVRKNGELLICHVTNSDLWSISKGKVDKGETFHDAAVRETYEETNIDLTESTDFVVHELEPVDYIHKQKILYPFLYLEKMDSEMDWSNVEIKCNSNVHESRGAFPEMDLYLWVTIEKARLMLHNTQIKCLDNINLLLINHVVDQIKDLSHK